MKTILLWDPRFPDRRPHRLTVADEIASAAVRAGVAAPADPVDAGILAGGSVLDPGSPTEVVLQHGRAGTAMARVMLPASVVSIGFGLGLIAVPMVGSGPGLIPKTAITFSNGEPLQFTDGTYLELSA